MGGCLPGASRFAFSLSFSFSAAVAVSLCLGSCVPSSKSRAAAVLYAAAAPPPPPPSPKEKKKPKNQQETHFCCKTRLQNVCLCDRLWSKPKLTKLKFSKVKRANRGACRVYIYIYIVPRGGAGARCGVVVCVATACARGSRFCCSAFRGVRLGLAGCPPYRDTPSSG